MNQRQDHRMSLTVSSLAVAAALAVALGCGGPRSWPVGGPFDQDLDAAPVAARNGRLVVNLVDAPAPELSAIFVTVDHVDAVTPSGTVPVMSTPITVDLLTLQNGQFLQLGAATLPEGEVSQLRLLLAPGEGHHVVLSDGSTSPLKIPSGDQSGIRLNGPFTISACSETTLTIDFDGEKSVQVHPAGPEHSFILRPVIVVKQVESQAMDCDEPDAGAPSR